MEFQEAASATPVLKHKLITTRAELNELRPEWNELLQQSTSNNVFLTWEWISSWWDCLSGDRRPWVLTIRQQDTEKLLGLTPLAQEQHTTRRGFHYRVLTFMGSYKAAPDHLDFIIDAEHERTVALALMKRLMRLRRQWDILSLSGLASESTLARLLRGRSGYRKISEEVCPYTELPADWETYRMTLRASERRNVGRKSRRLEKLHPGEVSYGQVRSEQELERTLATLFRLQIELRQGRSRKSAFADKRMREFHQRVASLFLKNGWLRFYRLRVGNEDIAVNYCFYYNNMFSGYSMAYSQDWKEHSPGTQLLAYTVQQAIREGAHEFDFGRGGGRYKSWWTNQVRKDISVEFSPSILRRFHLLYLSVGRRVRSVRTMMTNKGSE